MSAPPKPAAKCLGNRAGIHVWRDRVEGGSSVRMRCADCGEVRVFEVMRRSGVT